MSTIKASTLHTSHYTNTHEKPPFSQSKNLQLPRINNRRRRMNDLPSVSQEYEKPRVVMFYKNGDRNYRGSHVTVTPRRFRNFDNLLNELTRITNLAQGARYIFTPDNGSRVESLDQLADGKSYVCGSYPKLKKINYNHAPDGKSLENKKRANRNFIPVPAASKLNVENNRSHTTTIKPKVVSIIRNGVGINKKSVKILLNKRTAQSYEQVLDDITSAVGVQGGFVKKLYNIHGRLVQSLSDLFGNDDVFIAVGSEKFKPSSLPKILEESGVEKARTQSQSPASSKKETGVLPTPPKSSPTKKKKYKPLSSTYKPLTTHSKLPSIQKRNEPDDESHKSETIPNQETSHIDLSEKDLPDNMEETAQNTKENSLEKENSGNKNNPNSTISSESSNGSRNQKEESDTEKETLSAIESNDTKSQISNNSDAHVNLPVKVESESSSENLTNERKNSNSSSVTTSSEKDHTNLSESVATDSDEESVTKKEEELVKEQTSDSTMKSNINKLLDHENTNSKIEKTKGELLVYTERLSKVFDHSSEIEKYYDIGKKLGDGNFAVVKEVVDKSNSIPFALKIIDAAKMEGKLAMLNNEIKIQRECAHPNIVQLYHDMHSPTHVYLVMELISGGDFFDLISSNVSFEEEEASGYMRDLCSGLDYLHQREIIHRDIKPENLMVYDVNGNIRLKIADFGLAMKVTSPIFMICGTPTYVAPEILSEEGYGLEVDVWAAGVILFIMLCGFPPFRSPNRKQTELFDLIEKGKFEFLEPYWDDVSDTAKDLISKILVVDQKTRLTARQVFNHSWLSQYGLDRNNTIHSISPRRSNRFKTAAKSIQSIERLKLILRERENFITHVHHEGHSHSEQTEKQPLREHEEVDESDPNDEDATEEKSEKDSNHVLKDDTSNNDNTSQNDEVTDDDEKPRELVNDDTTNDIQEEGDRPKSVNERSDDQNPTSEEERNCEKVKSEENAEAISSQNNTSDNLVDEKVDDIVLDDNAINPDQ